VGGRDSLPVGRLCSLKRKTCGKTLYEMEQFVFRQSAGSGWARGLYQRRNLLFIIIIKSAISVQSIL
jgi:hypothetical protein